MMDELKRWVSKNMVWVDYGSEYNGMMDINYSQLMTLKGLVDSAILEQTNNA